MKKLNRNNLKLLSKLVSKLEAIARIKGLCFSEAQRVLVNDWASQIVICSTRRGGKSFSIAMKFAIRCLEKDNLVCAIVGLTYASIKRIFLKDAFKKLSRLAFLKDMFEIIGNEVRFFTGSVIYFFGLDKDDALEKIRGSGWDLFCIDETQSFRIDVKKAIVDIVKISSAGQHGTIMLDGTPGDVMGTYFNCVCDGTIEGWNKHFLHWNDNPFQREGIIEEIQKELDLDPNYKDTAGYKREYEGQWVPDSNWLVYTHYPDRNCDVDKLPIEFEGSWRYVLGADLGFSPDPSALVIGAYSHMTPNLYIVKAEKFLEKDFNELADIINLWKTEYKTSWEVIDGANKQGVVTIQNRLGIKFNPNNKLGKKVHIELLNGDLRRSRIKVLPEARQDVISEWTNLVWDRKFYEEAVAKGIPPWKELTSIPNHVSDATLYMFMATRQFLFKEEPKVPELSEYEKHEMMRKQVEQLKQDAWSARSRSSIDQTRGRPQTNNSLTALRRGR